MSVSQKPSRGLFDGPSLQPRRDDHPQPSLTSLSPKPRDPWTRDPTSLDASQTDKLDMFSRLPAEIRHMIYNLVFQPMTYHIKAKETPLITRTCKNLGSKSVYHPHCDNVRGDKQKLNHSLSLLFVNKQVHKEVCPVIYCQSSFTFVCINVLARFLNALALENWHRVPELRFTLLLQHHPEMNSRTRREWRDMWDTLQGMRGLREVYIRLSLVTLVRQRVLRQEEDESEWFGYFVRIAKSMREKGGVLYLGVVVKHGCRVGAERIDLTGHGDQGDETVLTEAYGSLRRHLRSGW